MAYHPSEYVEGKTFAQSFGEDWSFKVEPLGFTVGVDRGS
jgi:hypothetical protein